MLSCDLPGAGRKIRHMSLRACFWLCAAALAAPAWAQQPPAQPQTQTPVFRTGVELVSVDVTAVDGNGRQVTDLTAGEFQVEVDGEKRQVATIEYVRLVDPRRVAGAPSKVVAPDETFASSNAKGAPRGRLIVLLIDQGNIRTGAARPAMNSAKKFVDTLTPEDRVSVISIPAPGELVDFTTDHDKVREALLRIAGNADQIKSRFNISITEAMAVHLRSDLQRAADVIMRECAAAAGTEIDRCERDVEQDAGEMVAEVRRRTDDAVASTRAVLKSLAGIDGPKSVIYISEGLVFEGIGSETEDLAQAAADARASFDVLLLDVPRFDASQSLLPTTPREDRDLQVTGLEMLAGASRGGLYRINTSAEFAFDRISHSLDGYYLLGVEAKSEDKNGRRHRIGVKSSRRGVSIRSRRSFVTALSARAGSPTEAVTQALKSPLPVNDLPLKMSTWTYKDPASSRVRVLVAAEAERLVDQPLDYTVGVVIVSKDGRGVGQPVELKKLRPKAGDQGTAVYSSMLAVDPGQYRVIVSMADSEGRVGSVSRGVTAFQMDTKIGGISFDIMKRALEQARVGRLFILGKMKECMSAPRGEMSPFAPRITIMHINPDKIREVIGPGGKIIKKITEETGCQIDIEDTGEIRIAAVNMEGSKRAEEIIRNITEDPEIGRTYQGKVRSIVNFGAFVEIVPGRDGLLHVSEIDWGRTEKVEDVLNVGDMVMVKVVDVDRDGKIRLSRRALLS